ncbi:DUF2188 domain-containing protein [Methyloligella sp. 2.7D]|uniref:DUF2188 domain-containing protein n=1 Tax=unclassified Methyloligella TaxID=2625955 RepID=UPI00157CCAE6|nr:DUF2188 domain-containing protein [Methyloligella sp. GL2]QKP77529.1 DUF2188 domain-containing protein [Methyloligella sp. GL2]
MSRTTQFFIVFSDNAWHVTVNGGRYGPFRQQEAAVQAAVDAAYSVGSKGEAAEVLVQEPESEIRTAWIYGQDPYPLAASSRAEAS